MRNRIGLDKTHVYEPDPAIPGGVIRINPDGTRDYGQMVGRKFIKNK